MNAGLICQYSHHVRLGEDHTRELTRAQLDEQYAIYVAALRIAAGFGLDAVGIQYRQGLKDLVAVSYRGEGLLNATERPPVRSPDGAREFFAGRALTHFNEVDEGAVDGLITHLVEQVWSAPRQRAARRALRPLRNGRARPMNKLSASALVPAGKEGP